MFLSSATCHVSQIVLFLWHQLYHKVQVEYLAYIFNEWDKKIRQAADYDDCLMNIILQVTSTLHSISVLFFSSFSWSGKEALNVIEISVISVQYILLVIPREVSEINW